MYRASRKKRLTLMPLIALAGLSLAVTLPVLSSTQLHAGKPVTYTNVVVRPGDNLWALADARTPAGGDVQATVDEIVAANHLSNAGLRPGQHLRIPE
jgi:LysM repeat protein